MAHSSNRLSGKVAIITGGAGGQGANEARRFVAEGAKVVLTDLNETAGQQIARELGDSAIFVKHDVGNEQDWAAVIEAALSKFGKIDVLVNNAGIFKPGTLLETTVESFDQHYKVNQRGTFLGVRSVINAMKAAGGGSIVNISSAAGVRGWPDMISYAATKWAITGMTKAMARELAPLKIRVNSIHPGLVDTPMLGDHTPETLEQIRLSVPLERIATPDDVAEMVIYLASDVSSYVTGSAIVIDGGVSL